jgi:DNA-binding MarR family transcriptional regulator
MGAPTDDESRGMTKRPEVQLTQADYEALAALRYALRKFMDFSTSAAQQEGLPPQQHQALLAIKGLPEGEVMTVGMLAERLLVAPHTATELVGRLIASAYVQRETDSQDRRRQTLKLTRKAEDVLLRLSAIHLHEVREMAPRLIDILSRLRDDGR